LTDIENIEIMLQMCRCIPNSVYYKKTRNYPGNTELRNQRWILLSKSAHGVRAGWTAFLRPFFSLGIIEPYSIEHPLSTYYLTKMSSDTSFKLNTGATIPAVGLGTWQAPKGEVGKAVEHALKSGYKHIDAAWCYQVSLQQVATSYILISRTKMKSERVSKRLVWTGRISLSLPKCECALVSDGNGG
jgi:hypothetical protein